MFIQIAWFSLSLRGVACWSAMAELVHRVFGPRHRHCVQERGANRLAAIGPITHGSKAESRAAGHSFMSPAILAAEPAPGRDSRQSLDLPVAAVVPKPAVDRLARVVASAACSFVLVERLPCASSAAQGRSPRQPIRELPRPFLWQHGTALDGLHSMATCIALDV